ncbi:MAG: hypothetical protein QY318_00030 [Candidatus Dojkabacteria bacterium]|nr:MAG: hypothetical protein QY318_00030 [Candidatus Dojkabacteria bacterium]
MAKNKHSKAKKGPSIEEAFLAAGIPEKVQPRSRSASAPRDYKRRGISRQTLQVIWDYRKIFLISLSVGLIWFVSMAVTFVYINLSNYNTLLTLTLLSGILFLLLLLYLASLFIKRRRYLPLVTIAILVLFAITLLKPYAVYLTTGVQEYRGTCDIYVGRTESRRNSSGHYYIMESYVSFDSEIESSGVTPKTSEREFAQLTGLDSYPNFAEGRSTIIDCDGAFSIYYLSNGSSGVLLQVEKL